MSVMREHTRVMGILRRKREYGQDCTEGESAILKRFMRLNIDSPLTMELQDEIAVAFPAEYDESFYIPLRANMQKIDITDRRQMAEFERLDAT